MTQVEHIKRLIEASYDHKTREIICFGCRKDVECICIEVCSLEKLVDWYNRAYDTKFCVEDIERWTVIV